MIFNQDEAALREYLNLKTEKEKAIVAGNYADCRENIARRYGELLSYTDEGIQRLLSANTEREGTPCGVPSLFVPRCQGSPAELHWPLSFYRRMRGCKYPA